MSSSKVFSSGDDFFAGRSQVQRVLILRHKAALHVAEGGVGVDDAVFAQVLERHQVLLLPQPIQEAAAEGQGSEVAVDGCQQLLRSWKSANTPPENLATGSHSLLPSLPQRGGEQQVT